MDRNTKTANELSGYYRFADPIEVDELWARPNAKPASPPSPDNFLISYRTNETLEPMIMSNAIDTEKALSYFGFAIGFLGPISIVLKILLNIRSSAQESFVFSMIVLVIGCAVTAVTASVGYVTGKTVGRAVRRIEEYPLPLMLLVSALLGLGWGIFTGAAGGLLIFFVGAIWGGIVGGIAGALALPPFVLIHRYLKSGDLIERSKFAPIAAAILLSLCAFLLGA